MTLRVAAVLALGAALVPILAAPAQAQPATQIVLTSPNCGSTLTAGATCTLTVTLEDAEDNPVIDGSDVTFAQAGGDIGTVSGLASVTNHGDGTYTVTVTGNKAGTVS
ncbi:MAG: invasin domain 3-containing protein, partial [Acidimicrobiales bacterium]